MAMLLLSILWVVSFISFLICLVTYFFIKQTDGVVMTMVGSTFILCASTISITILDIIQ